MSTVVLLHGLARTRRSLAGLQRHLDALGYETWSCTYPSRSLGIADLAAWISEAIQRDLGDRPLYAVTHSLGGILVRHMPSLPWRGVVMLAPPNQGSRVAALLRDHPLFRRFYGPAGQDVADPSTWPPPPRPFAVIAGTAAPTLGNPTSWGTRALGLIPAGCPSDGTVLVDEARHPDAAAFVTVPASHTWIMNHPDVRELVVELLEQLGA
ncbi:MAG: hypothetical protein AMXMBFR64_14440 [Myxococcales bacterium]